ncbi:beta strand repeat-containing protein [Flagellimonas sp. 2504JD4-2]
MKKQIVHLIIGLLMITSLKGQIKIGDNPQTLDPSSVLELESTSRVLVITRVTDAQMNTITPLRGALVYNIDQQCVHYYNGTDWINICEAFDNSFTVSTEAVFNQFSRDSTVVVTQTDENYNFEVNLITGDNIVPTSINGDVHIQPSSITGGLLQDATVTLDKLADGENTGEVLQWNGNEWILVDETGLVVTEVDGEIGNEVLDATVGGSLVRNGIGTEVDPYTLDVSDGGIDNAELATDAVTTDKIQDGAVGTDDIANLAVTNIKLAADAITSDKVQDGQITRPDIADDAVDTNKIGTAGLAEANRILGTDAAGDPEWQDAASLAANLGEDVTSSNGSITGVQNDAALVAMDLEVNVDGATIEVDAVNGVQIADNGVTNVKLDKANIPLSGFGAATADVNLGTNKLINVVDPTDPQDAATMAYVDSEILASTQTIVSGDTGNLIVASGTDGGAFYDGDFTTLINVPLGLADGDDDTTYAAGTGLSLTGTTFSVDNANIAPDWANITNIPADIDDGDDDTTYAAGTGLSLTGTTFSVDNANIAPDWANITNIPADIDDGDDDTTYAAGTGLSLTGTTFSVDNANIAPDWANITNIPADIDDGDDDTTYAAGTGLSLTGTTFSVDNLAGDVTGPTSATVIANNAVTTVKILDANVTPAKIQQGTSNQILRTNNTGTTVEWANPITLYHAIGKANSSTLTNSNGITSITPLGTGNYQVNFSSNASSADYVIQLTLLNAGANATIEVVTQANNNFTVQITNSLGTAIDSEWYFTVTDF